MASHNITNGTTNKKLVDIGYHERFDIKLMEAVITMMHVDKER